MGRNAFLKNTAILCLYLFQLSFAAAVPLAAYTPETHENLSAVACEKICFPFELSALPGSEIPKLTLRWYFGAPKDKGSDKCWLPINRVEYVNCKIPDNGPFNSSTDCENATHYVSAETEISAFVQSDGKFCMFPGLMDSGFYGVTTDLGDGDSLVSDMWRLDVKRSRACRANFGIKQTPLSSAMNVDEESSGDETANNNGPATDSAEDLEEEENCTYPVFDEKYWIYDCTYGWPYSVHADSEDGLYEWPSCLGSHENFVLDMDKARPVLVYPSKAPGSM
ncbi:hypothetical protein [Cacatuid alphaherpesvirus 2]|uniref:Uncharacterized protein n=1 Tax=Cacatuid alphaherpesvirus 2 TaxID=2604840 RepID=A0A5B9R016_9ALPH|nr:hypothetical protein QKT46_gp73 [Cacatuid alphaherpesvirus 2]QEG54091.1 hypothetical protein [Cacatuid alphaherpesvirus 2]